MDIIQTSDFEQDKYELTFSNLVSKINSPDSASIILSEIGESELALELPPRSCAVQHSVFIEIHQIFPRSDKRVLIFSSTGKVIEVTELEGQRQLARVQLIQYAAESWARFLEQFCKRQAEITQFIEANHC